MFMLPLLLFGQAWYSSIVLQVCLLPFFFLHFIFLCW